ncbi:hypothetical protein HDU76_002469 [Blyttiomyces sp. JEL0837]|nr:hypothetical protein HDU76_002469 [Blyttiomyces sp. JEL0837]
MTLFTILAITLHAIFANTLLTSPVDAAFSVTNQAKLTYSATQVSSDTAKICVQGNIDSNQWIGFGIPAPNAPSMVGADLVISFPTPAKDVAANGSVTMLLGFGKRSVEMPFFSKYGVPTIDSSSYENGLLKACFLRPFAPTGPSQDSNGNAIVQNVLNKGPSTYLWSMGTVYTDNTGSTYPIVHTSRNAVGNIDLFSTDVTMVDPNGLPPTPNTTTTNPSPTVTTPNPTTTTTKQSSGARGRFNNMSLHRNNMIFVWLEVLTLGLVGIVSFAITF